MAAADQQQKAFALARQISDEGICNDELNCFCGDLAFNDETIVDAALYMRLGCKCVLHYHCLVQYLHYKIDDRLTMSLYGISCPFGSMCKSYCSLQEVNNDESKIYYITVTDLDNIVDYCALQHPTLKRYLAENNYDELSHQKVASLRQWIEEEKRIKDVSLVNENNLYILATTKACPSCNFPSTHYHHHHCHHISPAIAPKRGGCSNCHVEYCYQCLSTGPENLRLRGGSSICKCGSWSRFCTSITSKEQVDSWIAVRHGIPYDKRCGCVICTDCRYKSACDLCDGTCVVCRGLLQPSPLVATKDQSQLLPEMYGCAISGAAAPAAPRPVRAAAAPQNDDRFRAIVRNRELNYWLSVVAGTLSSIFGCYVLAYNIGVVLVHCMPILGNAYIKYPYFILCGSILCKYLVALVGRRGDGRTFSFRVLSFMASVGTCSIALRLMPWRSSHYCFSWPWSILEDSWLLFLTVITPRSVWNTWFLAFPVLVCRNLFALQIMTSLWPFHLPQPSIASITDVVDIRVLLLCIPVHIVKLVVLKYDRQFDSFRSSLLRYFDFPDAASTSFLYLLLEFSVGFGLIVSQSWYGIIAIFGIATVVSYALSGTLFLIVFTPLIVGAFKAAVICDYVRHYVYIHYLQHYSILTWWVIHIADVVAGFAITYFIGQANNASSFYNTPTVALHLGGFKALDLLRCVFQYAAERHYFDWFTSAFPAEALTPEKLWDNSAIAIAGIVLFYLYSKCRR